ncbi:MAG TPA: cobalamin-binding protein [Nitrosopumilaceae archaeon]|nr:cobalamin-binding protein [Nitrosopumilaceae archaeon]
MAQTISAKRIASFLPSATEILYELGAGDQLVGVTHECDYPEEAKSKPRVIKSSFDHTKMNSKEIDNQISNMMQSGSDIYLLDEQVLKKASPDLIIGQGLCDVCSPATKEISKAVSILNKKPEVVILDPHNVDDIFSDILQIAKHVGKTEQAQNLISSIQKRIEYVKTRPTNSRPKVLCIEWLDPLFTAGHWVPQMVEIAGGINGISITGERSRRMKLEEAMNFEPDTIVLMPCGFDINRIRQEYPKLASDSQWKLIPAVQTNHVYAVDANSYFSKPGPRTVTGIEILAKIIHPEVFVDLKIPDDSFVQINS